MSSSRWKFIVPGTLALLQIGGSVYHNFFGKDGVRRHVVFFSGTKPDRK